jgi:hypothetical protein
LTESLLAHKFQHKLSSKQYFDAIHRFGEGVLVISFDLSRVIDCPMLEGGTFYDPQESLYVLGIVVHNTGHTHLVES